MPVGSWVGCTDGAGASVDGDLCGALLGVMAVLLPPTPLPHTNPDTPAAKIAAWSRRVVGGPDSQGYGRIRQVSNLSAEGLLAQVSKLPCHRLGTSLPVQLALDRLSWHRGVGCTVVSPGAQWFPPALLGEYAASIGKSHKGDCAPAATSAGTGSEGVGERA